MMWEQKISFNLSSADLESLSQMAEATGYNRSDLLRRGIRVQRMLHEHLANGGEVLLRDQDGSTERLRLL